MKSTILRIATVALLAGVPFSFAEPLALTTVSPDELKWAAGATGNQQARITGDSSKPGMYMYRAKFPANFRNKPHFHPDERIGMVVSGTLLVGYGETIDEGKMKALPAGSIWTEPARQPHYVWAKDGEVVIQITGNGPTATTQVQQK